MSDQTVLRIQSPLSQKPLFLKVDSSKSVDATITGAIEALKNGGKALEAKQLGDLYASHQVFNAGQLVNKGSILSDLKAESVPMEGTAVNVIDLDLVAQHSGGSV